VLNTIAYKSTPKLNQTWLGWSLGGPLSASPFKMAAVTKIEISSIVYCCCIISKNVTAATWHLGSSRRV